MKSTNKLTLDKKKLTYNYIKLNKLHQIIYFDIFKAYDNVNIEILFNFIINDNKISPEFKKLALQEYFDIKNYVMRIGTEILYRKIGLAQGSLLSPSLFNYYLSRILEDGEIERYLIDKNIKPLIYADNVIIILNDFFSDEYVKDIIKTFENVLAKYYMKFDKPKILKFDKIAYPLCDIAYFPNIKNALRILGIEFYIHLDALCINYNPMKFEILPIKPTSFYRAIKHIKKYYLGKFNFYNEFLKIADNTNNLSNEYKVWFIDKIELWIRKHCVLIKIPENMINRIIFNEDMYPKYNYYSFWVSTFTSEFEDKILERYRKLCLNIVINEGLVNTLNAIKFILYGKTITIKSYSEMIKSLKLLDDIYFGIKTRRNLYEYVCFNNI